ncbi:class I adenylate-forming enzyme family protein [Streptomyces sp. NPDC127106]|uniref:class I adenylate-forming enzyme family protein n=1 Tax=Streptomyces sp. NPDC127106 TaxID=3345360 RepID=UPI00363A7832
MTARYVGDLVGALERYGARPALGETGGPVLDFSGLLGLVYRLAGELADRGVGRGTGLACVFGGNRAEVVQVRLAAHLLGARLTQVVTDAYTVGLDFVLRDCRPDLVVHDVPVPDTGAARLGLDELLRAAAEREAVPLPVAAREDDIARVTYTGGTTGVPKGVASTFRALAARTDGRAGREAGRPDTVAGTAARTGTGAAAGTGAGSGGGRVAESAAPPAYVSVTSLAHRAGGRCLEQLRSGGRTEILAPFEPRAFAAACRRLGPVATYLMPGMVYRLLDDPATAHGIPGLSVVSYGAAPILPERLRQAVTRWGGRWQQGYGMNESAVICRLTAADHEAAVTDRPGLLSSVGRPAAGVRVEVRDTAGRPLPAGWTGEVWTRSAAMMTGYWGRPDLTSAAIRDEWLRTGDLGHFDPDGYLHLDDRIADAVLVDGDNVHTLPVEAALARHPAVAQAVVVGRPSPRTGEEVCAFLVPVPGRTPDAATAAEACDLVERALSPAYRPTAVFWHEEIPLTPQGKPDKRQLRARAATL